MDPEITAGAHRSRKGSGERGNPRSRHVCSRGKRKGRPGRCETSRASRRSNSCNDRAVTRTCTTQLAALQLSRGSRSERGHLEEAGQVRCQLGGRRLIELASAIVIFGGPQAYIPFFLRPPLLICALRFAGGGRDGREGRPGSARSAARIKCRGGVGQAAASSAAEAEGWRKLFRPVLSTRDRRSSF